MKAGFEMDALVAEQVMGWSVDRSDFPFTGGLPRTFHGLVPCYSTDIKAAWAVVERLWNPPEDAEWIPTKITLYRDTKGEVGEGWTAEANLQYDNVYLGCSHCATAPEAICKVALNAVGYKEDAK